MREERRIARANLASAEAAARRVPSDPTARARVDQLRSEYRALALEDHIVECVSTAPPLSHAQRDRLALLLRGPSKSGGRA